MVIVFVVVLLLVAAAVFAAVVDDYHLQLMVMTKGFPYVATNETSQDDPKNKDEKMNKLITSTVKSSSSHNFFLVSAFIVDKSNC